MSIVESCSTKPKDKISVLVNNPEGRRLFILAEIAKASSLGNDTVEYACRVSGTVPLLPFLTRSRNNKFIIFTNRYGDHSLLPCREQELSDKREKMRKHCLDLGACNYNMESCPLTRYHLG